MTEHRSGARSRGEGGKTTSWPARPGMPAQPLPGRHPRPASLTLCLLLPAERLPMLAPPLGCAPAQVAAAWSCPM
eukprot:7389527-Prymnesium_polylepis.1